MTIAQITQGTSTATVIQIITDIIDLYDDTGPDYVASPATATPKLNEIALSVGVPTIEIKETALNAMLKINAIALTLETGGGVAFAFTYNGQPFTFAGQSFKFGAP